MCGLWGVSQKSGSKYNSNYNQQPESKNQMQNQRRKQITLLQSNTAHHTIGYDKLFNGRSKAHKSLKAKLSAWQQNHNHKKKVQYNKLARELQLPISNNHNHKA